MRRLIRAPILRGDPAPSKWTYRMERLWLTPVFRGLVRVGLPMALAFGATYGYLSQDGRVRAIVDGYEATLRAVQDRPEFQVGLLRIEGASRQLRGDIQEVLPIDLPLSRFQLDLEGIRDKLEELDPVLSAEVRVKSGGVLLLRIVERRPAVAWIGEHGVDVLDGTGHRVATLASLEEAGLLPLIAGPGAEAAVPEALRLLEAARPVHDRLIGLVRVGNRRWDVVLDGEKRILLPEDGPVAALDRALALDAARQVLARDVVAVDLRLPDRPTLRLNHHATADLRAQQVLLRTPPEEDE